MQTSADLPSPQAPEVFPKMQYSIVHLGKVKGRMHMCMWATIYVVAWWCLRLTDRQGNAPAQCAETWYWCTARWHPGSYPWAHHLSPQIYTQFPPPLEYSPYDSSLRRSARISHIFSPKIAQSSQTRPPQSPGKFYSPPFLTCRPSLPWSQMKCQCNNTSCERY